MTKEHNKATVIRTDDLPKSLVEQLGPELARAAMYVRRLAAIKFFGKVTLELQSGTVCIVRSEQVMKVPEL